MNYEDIKTWLDETQRNEHFFQKETNTTTILKEQSRLREVNRAFRDRLELMEMKGTLTKEAYLEWVKLWKATYAKLSFESRMSKRYRKASLVGDTLSNANISNVANLRRHAESLLQLRQRSKEAANQAWHKEREKTLENA